MLDYKKLKKEFKEVLSKIGEAEIDKWLNMDAERLEEHKQETFLNEKCFKCGRNQYSSRKPFCTDDFCNKDFYQKPKEEPKTNLEKLPFLELVKEFAEYYKNIPLVEEPKQETLEDMKKEQTIEQASEYYAHNYFDMHETNNYQALKQGFINGAKWQQEQDKKLYSEEQVKMLMFKFYYDMSHKMNVPKNLISENATNVDEWFKQYKKK